MPSGANLSCGRARPAPPHSAPDRRARAPCATRNAARRRTRSIHPRYSSHTSSGSSSLSAATSRVSNAYVYITASVCARQVSVHRRSTSSSMSSLVFALHRSPLPRAPRRGPAETPPGCSAASPPAPSPRAATPPVPPSAERCFPKHIFKNPTGIPKRDISAMHRSGVVAFAPRPNAPARARTLP